MPRDTARRGSHVLGDTARQSIRLQACLNNGCVASLYV